MNVTLRTPKMTREQFLDWVERQEAFYEFDGFEPVAMNGPSVGHNLICHNIYDALRSRLRGTAWRVLGPDVGVATVGNAVRFPDVVITAAALSASEKLVPGAVLVFEVVSPSSNRIDRIDKLGEYAAVPSIRRYVVVEATSVGVTVFSREGQDAGWAVSAVAAGGLLQLPELGIAVPVDEFYADLDIPDRVEASR